jgi:hypothetical protein
VLIVGFLHSVGAAGEGEEDVVEIGDVDGQPIHLDRRGVELVQLAAQRRDTAVAWNPQRQLFLVTRHLTEQPRRCLQRQRVREPQADVTAGDQAFELVRSPLGDQFAVVE